MDFQDIAYPKRYVRVIKGEYAGKEFEVIKEDYFNRYLIVKHYQNNELLSLDRSDCLDLTPVTFTKDGVTRKIAVGDEVKYVYGWRKVYDFYWDGNQWRILAIDTKTDSFFLTEKDIEDHRPIGIVDDPREKWLEEGRKNGWVENTLSSLTHDPKNERIKLK